MFTVPEIDAKRYFSVQLVDLYTFNPADAGFRTDGKWGVLHSGGRRESGTYTADGDRLVMKNDNDKLNHEGGLKWDADTGLLEIDSGSCGRPSGTPAPEPCLRPPLRRPGGASGRGRRV